jgi:uncharacterized damage-inducible protein DinB
VPTSIVIPRPAPSECGGDWDQYVAVVPGEGAWPVLLAQREEIARRFGALPEVRALHRYGAGKWSVKEVLGHLCDAERVYTYRALRFARDDSTPLPGFDEDRYVPAGKFDARSIGDLVDEWHAVREATLAFYRGLDAEAFARRGVANGNLVTVRALAWLVAGHARHHLNVLRDRYGIP